MNPTVLLDQSRSPLDMLSSDVFAALRCPAWCVEDPGHGLSDVEMAIAGGVWREHGSAETAVGEARVRITLAVDYSRDHGLIKLPPTVQVCGDAVLVAADAYRLAAVITDHAAFLPVLESPVSRNA